MDIERTQRNDIDGVADDRLTLAIDELNIEQSPYVLEMTEYHGNNWLLLDDAIMKYNIAEYDCISFMFNAIPKLSEKDITGVVVSFDYDVDDAIMVDNISLAHKDIVEQKNVKTLINDNGHMDISCNIFELNQEDINSIISEQGFVIGINFNGLKSNATVSISNVQLGLEFEDKLASESDSVVNRLEHRIDFYREGNKLILQIGDDAAGQGMVHGKPVDTYTKEEIDNKLREKVDAQIGKVLSSNDYTLTEKNKLAGIAQGANNYVHPSAHYTDIIKEESSLANLGTGQNATQHEINTAINEAIVENMFSGSYNDLTDVPSEFYPSAHEHLVSDVTDFPTIPSKTSDLQNDNGFITSASVPSRTSDLTNDGNDGTHAFIDSSDSRLTDARTPTSHNHDERYYTESEIDNALSGKSDTGHTHDNRYYTESEVDSALNGKSDTNHTHDNRYYTESEVNSLMNAKADNTHEHGTTEIFENDADVSYILGNDYDGDYNQSDINESINDLLSNKQDSLVSGTNIKTINNTSILGSGDISIQGGGGGSVDIATSWGNPTSNNKVPSEKLVKDSLDNKVDNVSGKGLSAEDYTSAEKTKLGGIEQGANRTVVDSALSGSSENPVQNKVINTALANKANSNHSHRILDLDPSTTDGTTIFMEDVDKDGMGASVLEQLILNRNETRIYYDKNSYADYDADNELATLGDIPTIDTILDATSQNSIANSAVTKAIGGTLFEDACSSNKNIGEYGTVVTLQGNTTTGTIAYDSSKNAYAINRTGSSSNAEWDILFPITKMKGKDYFKVEADVWSQHIAYNRVGFGFADSTNTAFFTLGHDTWTSALRFFTGEIGSINGISDDHSFSAKWYHMTLIVKGSHYTCELYDVDTLVASLTGHYHLEVNERDFGIVIGCPYNSTVWIKNIIIESLSLSDSLNPNGIQSNDDLNNYIDEGHYYCESNAIATTLSNCPRAVPFSLLVEENRSYGNGVKQTLTTYEDVPKTYMRTFYINNGSMTTSGWKLVYEDTGWQDISFGTGFSHYDSNNQRAEYRRIGKIVYVRGAIKNTSAFTPSNDTETKIGTIGDTTCRPIKTHKVLEQGSGKNIWLMSIETNGNIYIGRYGTTSNTQVGAGSWLNIYTTFMVD